MVVHACSPSTKEDGESRGLHRLHRNTPSKNPRQSSNHTQITTSHKDWESLLVSWGITDLGFLNLFAFVLDKRRRETKETGGLAECYPGVWMGTQRSHPPSRSSSDCPLRTLAFPAGSCLGSRVAGGSLCPLVLPPLLLFCI